MKCEEKYRQIFGRMPDDIVFCPYRISPLGAHIDHQHGVINGFAIDKGIYIAYGVKQNGVSEMHSLNFPKRAQFHVASVSDNKVGDWADHLRGAIKILSKKYRLNVGICGVIEGTLPIGGLSSSAAVIIAFLTAICRVNEIKLSPSEIIVIAQAVENEYVGVSCGKLDQSCEVLCRKDHLLYLDTLDDTYELIPANPAMKPYKIAIIFSGLERSLQNSGYNMRVDECKAASYALKAFSGMSYGVYRDTCLRDVEKNIYEEYKERLPETWRKRAEHFYSEFERAKIGAERWREGDLDRYGGLIFESGYSSIHNYDCGCEELRKIYEIMIETDGVYGGRFSGAGFKGCCMALINPGKAEQVERVITEKYLKAFPEMKDKFSFHLCDSADGI